MYFFETHQGCGFTQTQTHTYLHWHTHTVEEREREIERETRVLGTKMKTRLFIKH